MVGQRGLEPPSSGLKDPHPSPLDDFPIGNGPWTRTKIVRVRTSRPSFERNRYVFQRLTVSPVLCRVVRAALASHYR